MFAFFSSRLYAKGLIRDCTYSIRVYESQTVGALLEKAGFKGYQLKPGHFVRKGGRIKLFNLLYSAKYVIQVKC